MFSSLALTGKFHPLKKKREHKNLQLKILLIQKEARSIFLRTFLKKSNLHRNKNTQGTAWYN